MSLLTDFIAYQNCEHQLNRLNPSDCVLRTSFYCLLHLTLDLLACETKEEVGFEIEVAYHEIPILIIQKFLPVLVKRLYGNTCFDS